MKQLQSGFKGIINWNKYQSKLADQQQNIYFDFLIYPSFQGVNVNRLFVLLFENRTDGTVHTVCYTSNVEIKDYTVITDGKNLFDRSIKNDLKNI